MKQFKASKDVRFCLEAYPQWKVIVANCPKQSKNLYINGAKIMEAMIAQTKSDAERDSLIAELMHMYDVRIANYGDAANVTAMKAMDLESYRKEDALKDCYDLYLAAVKLDGIKPEYVVKFMETTIRYVKAGFAEPTLVVDNYDIASDLLDKELDKADSAKGVLIRSYIAGVENAFSPYADCSHLVEIYSKKFQADPNNVDLLKKITNIMMKKGCTEEQLFFDATDNLYKLEPSPITAYRMGQMCVSKKRFADAVKYLTNAVNDLEAKSDKYGACMLLGYAQAQQGSYAAARSSYYRAAEIDNTKGDPYLQIASLYMSHHSSDDGMGGRSAYWAAADKAARARSIDPSVADDANRIISKCAGAYPKKADAFMLNLMDGQSFVVPGWIGESTTVRTR